MTSGHLADAVREFGDLRPFQSQGLEHTHSQRKVIALHLTNRRPESASNSVGRTEQTMGVIVAEDACRKRNRHSLDQQAHQQKAQTKKAKTEKRVKELAKQGVTKVVAY